MPKEQVEEYIEAIFDIAGEDGHAKTKEVAKRLDNAPASVTEVFQNMDQKGLQKGTIAFLRGSSKVIQRLSDLGLTLGTEVRLIRKTPMDGPIELSVRRTALAVGHDIADNIFVQAGSES